METRSRETGSTHLDLNSEPTTPARSGPGRRVSGYPRLGRYRPAGGRFSPSRTLTYTACFNNSDDLTAARAVASPSHDIKRNRPLRHRVRALARRRSHRASCSRLHLAPRARPAHRGATPRWLVVREPGLAPRLHRRTRTPERTVAGTTLGATTRRATPSRTSVRAPRLNYAANPHRRIHRAHRFRERRDRSHPRAFVRVYHQPSHPDLSRRWFWTAARGSTT